MPHRAIRSFLPFILVALLHPLVSCGGGSSAGSSAGDAEAAQVALNGPAVGSLALDTSSAGRTASGAYGWVSAPADFLRGPQLDVVGAAGSEYSYNRAFPFPRIATNPVIDWTRPAVTSEQLSGGVKLSTAQALKPGSTSLQWNQHPKYPSIMSELVGTPDWSSYGGVYAAVYSAQATKEVITLGVLNDNPATPYLDYWTTDITIDWTGWKEISVPFGAFSTIGSPTDWTSVSGLYFFSKTKLRSPNPDTDLSIGQLALLPKNAAPPVPPPVTPASGLLLSFNGSTPVYVQRNHTQPELSSNLADGTGNAAGTRLSQQPFFAGARSLHNYNPRFDPGFVSVDPKGRSFVRSQGDNGLTIQWLDANQKWQVNDLTAVVKAWIVKQNNNGKPWTSTSIVASESVIRFDKEGDAYLLVDYLNDGPGGVAGTLLLHSKDVTSQNWQIYSLSKPGPNYFRGILADFEKVETFNQDALNHPPVITLTGHNYAVGMNQATYLVVPVKNADGSLTLPAPIEYSPYGLIGPVHSGGGNFVISKGDNIYLIYGYMAPPTGANGAPNATDTTYMAKKPPIAANNAANALTYAEGSKVMRAVDGVPIFVRSYNRTSKALSEPVFIGYGGVSMDGHNWPAMTIDADGYLHAILNGHINPLGYTRTVRPGDISQWTDEVYVNLAEPNSANVLARASYGAINTDKNNKLFVTTRSDTGSYNHRLGTFSKPARPVQAANPPGSEKWSAEHSIVVPFNDNYHVWTQRTTYDPVRHRYYFGYFDQGGQTVLSHDAYLFNRFIWPDYEKKMTGGKAGSNQNEGLPPVTGGAARIFTTERADFTLLVSDDGGANWRIATTPDFAAN
jgi:BNR repeat-containing family member